MKKLALAVSCLALLAAGLYLLPVHKVRAQVGGVATVVGGVSAINQFGAAVSTGVAGAVTNPASNFVMNVAGGAVYFGGNVQTIAHSTLTLPASSTNLIVWNGFKEQLYSKQAVTGPGSQGTNAINGPGFPTALLFADPNQGEIPLATVVCNATACGNGGNGSITDNRPLAAFPMGTGISGTTFANLPAAPNGTIIYCADCTVLAAPGACAGSGTGGFGVRLNGAWTCI